MVHALEEIRRLLKPDGSLIDIHPFPEAPMIEIQQGGKIVFGEPVPAHGYEDKRQAENALAQVVQCRLFVVEGSAAFDFLIYGSSVAELRDFLVEQSCDSDETARKWAVERAELAQQVEEAMQASGEGAEVAYHERVCITHLKPG